MLVHRRLEQVATRALACVRLDPHLWFLMRVQILERQTGSIIGYNLSGTTYQHGNITCAVCYLRSPRYATYSLKVVFWLLHTSSSEEAGVVSMV